MRLRCLSAASGGHSVLRKEVRSLGKLAGPVVLCYLFQSTVSLVSIAFSGHASAEDLEAAALGQTFIIMSVISVTLGLCSALDTLCGQAYGAGNFREVGLIVQRLILILTLLCVPVACFWLLSERVFVLLRLDAQLAAMAGSYLRYYLPGLWPMCMYEAGKKYLQAQGIVNPIIAISLLGNGVNVLCCWLFIARMEMGYKGVALAGSATQWTFLLSLLALCLWKGYHKRTWPGWTWEVLDRKRLKMTLRLGMSGVFMICAEYWTFEICTVLMGVHSSSLMAAFVIGMQVIALNYMVPLGIGVAVSTRCSNALGGGRPDDAKRTAKVGLGMAAVACVVTPSLTVLARHQIAGFFTSDDEISALVAAALPAIAGFQILDIAQGVLSGVVRGCGLQKAGAYVNLAGYYLIAMPLAVVFVFAYQIDSGMGGVILALCCGQLVIVLCFLVMTYRLDWHQQAILAQLRSQADSVPADNDPEDGGEVELQKEPGGLVVMVEQGDGDEGEAEDTLLPHATNEPWDMSDVADVG